MKWGFTPVTVKAGTFWPTVNMSMLLRSGLRAARGS
jgi:hypothetical protein